MKKVFLLAIAVGFAFASCKDNKAEATTDATAPTTEIHADHEDHTGHDHGTETTTPAQNAAPTQTGTPAQANASGAKLNPPHGEPGHRCEIPVGAPLDGSGGTTAAPQVQAQPTSNSQGFLSSGNAQAQPQATPQQAAKPAQQTAPGMQGKPNPAHGQPGHRCDVQVGQPLP